MFQRHSLLVYPDKHKDIDMRKTQVPRTPDFDSHLCLCWPCSPGKLGYQCLTVWVCWRSNVKHPAMVSCTVGEQSMSILASDLSPMICFLDRLSLTARFHQPAYVHLVKVAEGRPCLGVNPALLRSVKSPFFPPMAIFRSSGGRASHESVLPRSELSEGTS